MSKLKVFRTSIGFHDAYVAAPSQKAALEAWGTDKNLFARGSAEVVTDGKLTAQPLASPGTVIKLSRGSLAEQLAATPAAPETPARLRRAISEQALKPRPRKSQSARDRSQSGPRGEDRSEPKPKANPKPKPRPSRDRVDQAGAAIEAFEQEAAAEKSELRKKEEALRKEREALDRKHRAQLEKLQGQLGRAEDRYRDALTRWRSD